MLLVCVFGLVCVLLNSFCLCVALKNLLFLGMVLWLIKIVANGDPRILDEYFLLPLVYDVLIFCVLLLYLISLYQNGMKQFANSMTRSLAKRTSRDGSSKRIIRSNRKRSGRTRANRR